MKQLGNECGGLASGLLVEHRWAGSLRVDEAWLNAYILHKILRIVGDGRGVISIVSVYWLENGWVTASAEHRERERVRERAGMNIVYCLPM